VVNMEAEERRRPDVCGKAIFVETHDRVSAIPFKRGLSAEQRVSRGTKARCAVDHANDNPSTAAHGCGPGHARPWTSAAAEIDSSRRQPIGGKAQFGGPRSAEMESGHWKPTARRTSCRS